MTKTDMTGENPQEVWSVNLSGVKFYASLIASVAGVIVLALTTVTFAGESIFERQLKEFHETAQPAVAKMVDEKIALHQSDAMQIYLSDLSVINQALARIDEHSGDVDARLERIENLLWELKNGGP